MFYVVWFREGEKVPKVCLLRIFLYLLAYSCLFGIGSPIYVRVHVQVCYLTVR